MVPACGMERGPVLGRGRKGPKSPPVQSSQGISGKVRVSATVPIRLRRSPKSLEINLQASNVHSAARPARCWGS